MSVYDAIQGLIILIKSNFHFHFPLFRFSLIVTTFIAKEWAIESKYIIHIFIKNLHFIASMETREYINITLRVIVMKQRLYFVHLLVWVVNTFLLIGHLES